MSRNTSQSPTLEIPTTNHDLSYIPFVEKLDDPNFVICDSTNISSGRNRIQYEGGMTKLKNDINSNYTFKNEYQGFKGYVVIRFLVNCEGELGRFRGDALNLDFSPSKAPENLVAEIKMLFKTLNNWTRRSGSDPKGEYSKYINIKIDNGKIQHIIL